MTVLRSRTIRVLLRNKKFLVSGCMVLFFILVGAIGPFFTQDPYEYTPYMDAPPSPQHRLGTDFLGRDVLAQLVLGIRHSIEVGVIAGIIGLSISIILGGLGGYEGGLIGEIINIVANIFLVLPVIPLLIVLSGLLRYRSLILVALFIGLITGWAGSARAIRAQVMSLREKEFVKLARITGKSSGRIVFGEIFSNMVAYIFLLFCSAFASAMLAEAGISLLGLGPTQVITLGMMLHWAIMTQSVLLKAWWVFVPPGLALVVLTASLYTISSVVDEIK